MSSEDISMVSGEGQLVTWSWWHTRWMEHGNGNFPSCLWQGTWSLAQLNGTRQSAKFTLHTYRPLENFGYYLRICCNMTHFILFSFSFRKFSLLIVMSFNFSCKNEMLAQDIQTSSKITFLFLILFNFYFYTAGTY